MRAIKWFLKRIFSGVAWNIGKIITYLVIGLLIYIIAQGFKVDASSFSGLDTTISDTYYNLFSGYIRNLDHNDNYVAYAYSCNSGSSYNNTCYALAFSPSLAYENGVFSAENVELIKYDYVGSNRVLTRTTDTNFKLTSDFYYSNLGNSSSLEGGMSTYEKAIILFISIFICFYIIKSIFIFGN